MSYMEQQMQNHIEAGLSEADRCYSKIAELEQRNALLAAELEARNAMIEMLCSAVRGVQAVPSRSGFAVNDPNPKAEFIAWAKLNEVMAATPEECLRQIRAEAVEKAANFLRFAPVDGGQRWAVRYVDLLEYAERVKAGEI